MLARLPEVVEALVAAAVEVGGAAAGGAVLDGGRGAEDR